MPQVNNPPGLSKCINRKFNCYVFFLLPILLDISILCFFHEDSQLHLSKLANNQQKSQLVVEEMFLPLLLLILHIQILLLYKNHFALFLPLSRATLYPYYAITTTTSQSPQNSKSSQSIPIPNYLLVSTISFIQSFRMTITSDPFVITKTWKKKTFVET